MTIRKRWLVAILVVSGLALAAGTKTRFEGNLLVFDGVSGANAFSFDVDGLRGDFGTGSTDYIDSNGTYARVGAGAGYLASAQPFTLDSVYVNNLVQVLTYGGGTLPARAFTVTGIKFYVRANGVGGTTNNTFQVTDGTNTCDCSFACNVGTASRRATCSNGAGTGCVYAASAVLSYGFSAIGDCGTATDLLGNVSVEGNWQ